MQPKQVTMPDECLKSMQDLQNTENQAASQKCEDEGKYGDKAIAALRVANEHEAVAHVHEVFMKCGKLSEKCAALVAPRLVQEMRLSGVAVSDECKAEYSKVQNSEKAMAATADCDNKEKLAEKTLAALNNGEADSAIDSTEQGLERCMNISKPCAFQLAPVMVNSVVQRAMMEAAMTQVLVAQPVLVVDAEPVVIVEDDGSSSAEAPVAPAPKKSVSLLQMAASIRPAGKTYKKRNSMVREAAVTTESLVQTSHSHHSNHAISKLLLDLLVNRK